MIYIKNSDPQALVWLERLINQDEDPNLQLEAECRKGFFEYDQGNFTEAEHSLKIVAEQSVNMPAKALAQYSLGVLCINTNRGPQAKEWLTRAANQMDHPSTSLKAQALLASAVQGETA